MYEVSAEELAALSAGYHQAAAEIEANLAGLAARIAQLREGWIGSASGSFQATAAEIEKARQELDDALHRMAALLASAGQAYSSTEQSISQAFGP